MDSFLWLGFLGRIRRGIRVREALADDWRESNDRGRELVGDEVARPAYAISKRFSSLAPRLNMKEIITNRDMCMLSSLPYDSILIQ